MKTLAALLAALLLVLASCEDIPLALTVKDQVAEYKASTNPAAAPTFSPSANTYNTDQLITISSSTIGATLRYTTDGSVPTAQSAVYTAPVAIASPGGVINAIAVKTGFKDSTVATAAYTIDYDAAATPQISPSTGTFTTDQSVSISSATTGAVIHFTTDGSDPTAASPVYTGPIAVAGHGTVTTVKALAVKDKFKNSGITSTTITIAWPKAAAPQILPATGTYSSDQTVAITNSTVGAVIHYTLDGSAPTTASPVYGSPLAVAGNGTTKTIKAIAVKNAMVDSDVSTSTVTINYSQVSSVQFSSVPGTFDSNLTLSLSTSTSDATIYYTTDLSAPTVLFGTKYTSPIALTGPSATLQLRAIAVKGGMTDSTEASGTFTVQWLKAEMPALSLPGGGTDLRAAITFTEDTTVGLVTVTPGATIYSAVTSGTTGVTPANLYGGTFALTGSQTSDVVRTITAFTRKAGMLDSDLVTVQVTVAYPVADAPAFSTGSGNPTLTTDQAVQITTPLTGGSIYYTINGDTPTTALTPYGGSPIGVMGSQTGVNSLTIKAFTAKQFYKNSPVVETMVSVAWPQLDAPVFSKAGGTYSSDISVSLASDIGTSLKYTTDGSAPSSGNGTVPMMSPNSENLNITGSGTQRTISAYAFAANKRNSPTTTAVYSITYTLPIVTDYNGTTNSRGDSDTPTVYQLPLGIVIDDFDYLYVGDALSMGKIRMVSPGSPTNSVTLLQDNFFNDPWGMTRLGTTFYVVSATMHQLQKFSFDGSVWSRTFVAGAATPGSSNGSGSVAMFNSPKGLTNDGTDLYVADTGNQLIRKVTSAGSVSTLAGTVGVTGSDNATGTAATFSSPTDVATDGAGNLYVADTANHLIRKVVISSGAVTTFAGGSAGFVDETGTQARFNAPLGLACDGTYLYVADSNNYAVRKIHLTTAVVTTLAGTGTAGHFNGNGAGATFNKPLRLAYRNGYLYVVDNVDQNGGNNVIRRIQL